MRVNVRGHILPFQTALSPGVGVYDLRRPVTDPALLAVVPLSAALTPFHSSFTGIRYRRCNKSPRF